MTLHRFACGAIGALLIAPAALATSYTWPGAAPCNGTLQACITGTPGGARIEIATATPIAEDISIYDRNLTLTAADGYAPQFAAGHNLSVTSSGIAGNLNVAVSHLRFANGYVFANYNSSATATYDFEDLTLGNDSSGTATYIEADANGGTINLTLINNRVYGVPSGDARGLVHLANYGATLNVNAYYNHVTSTALTNVVGGGILANFSAGSSTPAAGTLKLHGNTVRGSFNDANIFLSEGAGTVAASHFSVRSYNNVLVGVSRNGDDAGYGCLGFVVRNGTIDAQAYNNTLSHCSRGIAIHQYSGGGAGAGVSGSIVNNIVVATYLGFDFQTVGLSSLPLDSYNLINAPSSTIGYGLNSITAAADLVLDTAPRLRPTSPAIDAADSAALAFGLIFNTLPTNDADGLRRFKGASNKADIGAYEFGDVEFTHTANAANTGSNVTTLDNASLHGNAAAALIATSNYNIGLAGGVDYDHPFGAYYPTPDWALFNQDHANALPLGTHFDVFVPAPGSGSFVHVSSAPSISGSGTVFSDTSTDGLADRIVLVTQNWSAGGSGLYNPSPVGVFYGLDSKWHIANLDGAAMQQPLGFNIYAQEPSPNAWRAIAGTTNEIRLDHPLLDNTPCARPQATRLQGASLISHNFNLNYSFGKWYIEGYGGGIAAGEKFNVLVDPAQVFDCTDRIFSDGFDG